jgi:putative phage-type endonuclease
MTARLVLPGTATEAEWLAARRQGITASEIAIVMGLSPYSSPFALFHRKTGDLPEQPDNVAMALGRHLEAFVADEFESRHPEFSVMGDGRDLYAHGDRPWQLATPDRLIEDAASSGIVERDGVFELENLAVLECKTDAGYDGWGGDGTDEIPVHYRCQVLWQMDVLGVTTGYVACLFLHSRTLRVYELTMDDAARHDLTLMRIEALRFLDRVKGCGPPPEPDWRPATTAALKALHPSVVDKDMPVGAQMRISYQAAVRNYKAAEHRKDEMTNVVLQSIGDGRRAVDPDGTVIASRQVYDVKASVRKAYTVNKLVPAREQQ